MVVYGHGENLFGMLLSNHIVIKNLFYLIRDRLGIKPLYFTIQNDDLAYASELKSLLLIPGLDKQIDFETGIVLCILPNEGLVLLNASYSF